MHKSATRARAAFAGSTRALATIACATLIAASPTPLSATLTPAAPAAPTPATLQGAHVGFYAIDLASGATLADRDSTGDFTPASTMKLLAGSAALDLLPSDFTFTTRLALDGTHLYLVGGGDPTLDDRALDDAATTVAVLGIHRIDALSLDTSHYDAPWYPPGWEIDDLPYDYSAPITALSLDENVMHVVVAPGARAGDPATIVQPNDATMVVASNAITTGSGGSEDTSDIQRDALAPMLHLVGAIPIGGGDVTLDAAIPDPMRVIASRTLAALQRHGIDTSQATHDSQPAPPGAREVWRRNSVGLSQLLPQFWLPSDNFYGEMFFNEIGGASSERKWLQSFGVDPTQFTIVDGSGLSSYDRVTPRGLVAILTHDWAGPHKSAVLDALPIAGVRGTLQNRFKGTSLQGVLYAKTGTVNHTRTLAGYLITPRRTIAFALLIEDWMDTSPTASKSLEAAQHAMLERVLVPG